MQDDYNINNKVQKLISYYNMELLKEEGVYFKNLYQSSFKLKNGKPMGTAIIALYSRKPKSYSKFHKLDYDEVWHFYEGDPFNLYILYPNGTSETIVMGSDYENEQTRQKLVPAGAWQAAELHENSMYSLFACTMVPGYDSAIFESADKNFLITKYPDYKDVILRLV